VNANSPQLPLLTPDLPGTGGSSQELEDFVVEEIPAYTPSGAGEHCMALVRKRGLTTPQAVKKICAALKISPRGAGHAGMKDRQGVTTQWLSFAGARPEDLLGLGLEDIEVLEAAQHGNKLRTGHLRGNRFTIILRDTCPGSLERAQAVLDRLVSRGMANYFGPQRFGRRGDNAQQGLAILRGDRPRPRDKMQHRLLISALQSELFNQTLARRLERGLLWTLLGGEVLQRAEGRATFISEDQVIDQVRLDQGEVVITGPICGPRMIRPAQGTAARTLEDEVLQANDITVADFASAGRLARGGRRPLTVPLEQASVQQEIVPEQGRALRLNFALPPGSYATVLLREITKNSG